MTSENAGRTAEFHCIFLAGSQGEWQFVAGLMKPAGIRVHYAASVEEADRLMTLRDAAVLLADVEAPGCGWEDAMNMLNREHPTAALVLASREADEGFWIDVLDKGAYDLIRKPFVASELRRILENANAHARYTMTAAARS